MLVGNIRNVNSNTQVMPSNEQVYIYLDAHIHITQ
jgi:hypothetical protein